MTSPDYGPDSTTGGVDHLLSEAGDGPWWPEPPLEDEPSGVPSFWLTNAAGNSLHFDANDAAALLGEVRRLREVAAAARDYFDHAALGPDPTGRPDAEPFHVEEWRARRRLAATLLLALPVDEER